MPALLALMLNPLTWASAGLGAFIGSQVDDVLDKNPTNSPYNSGASSVDWNKVMLYAGGAVLIAYGAKKVFE